MFLDATRRSRIETRQRCHKSLYEARKTRGQDAAARQTKIQIGIEAVFKAPADHERVCILNEPERCCRRSAMPRGENSATRRPAKRIKKIHEGIALHRAAPLSTAQSVGTPRIARERGEKSRTGWSARIASSSGR